MAPGWPLRHIGQVPLVRARPDDLEQVSTEARILNAAQTVDDPEAYPVLPGLLAGELRYGWDSDPSEHYLYLPDESESPVAVVEIDLPMLDNRHLVWFKIVVDPEHRRRGHGTALVQEVVRRAEQAGRTTLWATCVEDDLGARKFLENLGFSYASHDARRRQVLAEIDRAAMDRLYAVAEAAAADYRLERLRPPISDQVLTELIEVTAAINDAPMGTLTFEDEVFDLARLRTIENNMQGRGDRGYRVVARHRETGEVGGHTFLAVNPLQPWLAGQGDTAVARQHRGHKLGLLVKIEMLRWLAEAEPQLEVIETWNNVDNRFMIDVNEAMGYRLSAVYATFERNLELAR
jgi:RimJ/RimL family protein N-acetyltransferase